MNNKYFVFVLILLFSFSSHAQILGFLEIPKLIKKTTPDGPPGSTVNEKAKIKVYSKPDKKQKILIEARVKDLDTVEFEYEESGFFVYGMVVPRHGNWKWYQIKTTKGKGWVYSDDVGAFHDLGEKLKNSLTYVNSNWDKKLYKKPQAIKFLAKETEDMGPYDETTQDIQVLQTENFAGVLWLEIQEVNGRCEAEETLGKKGWIPALNNKKQMTVWFYPRGC